MRCLSIFKCYSGKNLPTETSPTLTPSPTSKATMETSNAPGDLLKQLEMANDKTKEFTLQGLETQAKCTKCYDADTVHLVIPYGDAVYRWTCRLERIDSAEIKSTDPEESTFAKLSRDYLQSLILDKIVGVKCGKFDKYGRLLVYLTINGLDINQHLLDKGYAYQYAGGKKITFAEWHS